MKHKEDWYLIYRIPEMFAVNAFFEVYVIITFLYYIFIYHGIDPNSVLSREEMFAFNDNAPFWAYYKLLIPIICVLPALGLEKAINFGKNSALFVRKNKEDFLKSCIVKIFIGVFMIVLISAVLSILLSAISFADSGITFEGAKYSGAYWLNVTGDYKYDFLKLHIIYPQLYNLIYSIIFSFCCAVFSTFYTVIRLLFANIKQGYFLVGSAVLAFAIYEVDMIFNISFWDCFIVSCNNFQNRTYSWTIIIAMILAAIIIVSKICRVKRDV